MNKIIIIFSLLDHNERQQAYFLFFLMLIMALLDVLGIASILPFIAVLSNPDQIETNYFLNFFYEKYAFKSIESYLSILGLLFLLFFVMSLSFKAYTYYFIQKFVMMREYSLSKKLLGGYLHQPFSWFLNKHSSDLTKNIFSEVGTVVGKSILPILNLLAHSIVAISIFILLFLVNFKITLTLGLFFIFSYILIYQVLRKSLYRIGGVRFVSNKLRFKIVNDAFETLKSLKVDGLEKSYINKFSQPAKKYANSQAFAQISALLPRYLIEAVAFSAILLITLNLMSDNQNFSDITTLVALYAFAGYRLLPALQQIYSSYSQIHFSSSALENLSKELKEFTPQNIFKPRESMSFRESIVLKDLSFIYPKSKKEVLKNINMTIKAKSLVGIVGSSGSGKSTLIDVILALLEPNNGLLKIDNQIINKKNYQNWQNVIGYVPQDIRLIEDTIFSNIAFSIDDVDINLKAVYRAAKIAKLDDFINSNLPKKYETVIGEHGKLLSGGQRQRIGIARALYKNPQVLILDEATNALDSNTEHEIIKELKNLKNKTVIVITHRVNVIKDFDWIFLIDEGKLIDQGNYNKLFNTNKLFQKLINSNL